jgi:hypothetical protein
MTIVTFTRDEGDLFLSAIYVEGERLVFDDNHEAQKDLEVGALDDIHWRIVGPSGATLLVSKTVNEVTRQIVQSAIPDGADRLSDFKLFKV